MNNIILSAVTLNDLLFQIEQIIDTKICVKQQKTQPVSDYVTRQEVCSILKITLPTLNHYSKEGFLTSYKIGSRVLYKKSEINEAIETLAQFKFKKGGRKNG